jgi:hypothetical protein
VTASDIQSLLSNDRPSTVPNGSQATVRTARNRMRAAFAFSSG